MCGDRLRVLVIDDDPADVELLQRHLALLDGWESDVELHSSADSVLPHIGRDQPDVIFVDFYLGATSGIDVVKAIRGAGHLAPIIMLTGQGSQSIVKDSLTSGADDYLDKNSLDAATLRRSLQHAGAQYQRRNVESQLRLTQFSIDHAADPIMWVRADGQFTHVNNAACQLLGYAKEELLGLRVQDVSLSVNGENWQDSRNLLKASGARTREDVLRARDGTEIPVELRLNYVQWNNIERSCAFARDLRERKRSEANLREKEEQLRHKLQLEAVGALAGGIAHEFNNLLQAIRGFAALARDGLDARDERHHDLTQVIDAADRAAELTRQLLGFSRRQVLERVRCDPNEVVADLTKMLRPVIGEQIEVRVTLEPHVGYLFADRTLLLQNLLNLCINARDAMPAGGLISIATRQAVVAEEECETHGNIKPGHYIALVVADNGCGMPREVKDRIFEPFFTTKGIGKGTGLGLAMVYGNIQQHGGAVTVDSTVGRGTTFTLYLPMAEDCPPLEEHTMPNPVVCGQETILVAEDESMVRDLAVRILTRAGYSVLVAADGAEAVQVFEAHRDEISLAVLDVIMPKVNGHEVYERIKCVDRDVPIVFCSGYDPETEHVKVLVDVGVRILQKPFTAEALLGTIREVLDSRLTAEVSLFRE